MFSDTNVDRRQQITFLNSEYCQSLCELISTDADDLSQSNPTSALFVCIPQLHLHSKEQGCVDFHMGNLHVRTPSHQRKQLKIMSQVLWNL